MLYFEKFNRSFLFYSQTIVRKPTMRDNLTDMWSVKCFHFFSRSIVCSKTNEQ